MDQATTPLLQLSAAVSVNLQTICHLIPKIELHRHLSGSFRQDSLHKLLPKEYSDVDFNSQQRTTFGNGDAGPAWQQSLRRFEVVSKTTSLISPILRTKHRPPRRTPPETIAFEAPTIRMASEGSSNLRRLVAEAIEDLHADNVIYCEFRIGIKNRPTKRQYLDDVIAVIQEQKIRFPNVTVKLLLSIARHKDVANAQEMIDVAIEYFQKKPRVVCGVELGGVATKGNWSREFAPLFDRARSAGLPVALHCGENADNQAEIADMIKWKPERLGHCVFANDANLALIVSAAIPVEVCMECHHRSYAVDYKDNLLRRLKPSGLAVLATDNPSFLQSSLSHEFVLASVHQELTLKDVHALCTNAIHAAFASDDEKRGLIEALAAWWKTVLQWIPVA